MSREPLDYENPKHRVNEPPQVSWPRRVSYSLMGIALVCVLVALAWPERRSELFAAAIAFAIGGVASYFPHAG